MGKRLGAETGNPRENAERVPVGACRCAPWGVCVTAALCPQLAGWPCGRASRPVCSCVSGRPCAFERLRVLYVHVSVSVENVCVYGRVTLSCIQAGPGTSRRAQHPDCAGLQVAMPRITEAVAPPASPGFKDAGLVAALWPPAGEGI